MTVELGRTGQVEQDAAKERPLEPALEPAELRMFLRDISWETYERILADNEDRVVPRLTYDRGVLELMSPSTRHEMTDHIIGLLVEIVADELEIDVVGAGHTTFRRADLQRGFEPDGCFYVTNEALVRGKEEIDLMVDPPPDLLIEVDISSSSFNKLSLFAEVGVPEVWRYDGERLRIFRREGDGYVEADASGVLPPLTGAVLTGFIEEGKTERRRVWVRSVREWARRQAGGAGERQA
jgi:Uma2 family endonuclease